MSYPINPNDPSLPNAWRKQPSYTLEIATLTRRQPEGWEADMWELEQHYPGWFVSHDIEENWFDPLDDADSAEEYEEKFAQLAELQAGYFEQAVQRASQYFRTNDFRKAEGLAKLFAGRSGGFLTPEQRQSLVAQINTPVHQSSSKALRKAFVELEDGFAVAGVIVQDLEYPGFITPFVSPFNPVLTLIGREVVACEAGEYEQPLARGILELDDNRLKVGDWSQDFSDSEVDGTPFESVELLGNQDFEIIEKAYFQENYVEDLP